MKGLFPIFGAVGLLALAFLGGGGNPDPGGPTLRDLEAALAASTSEGGFGHDGNEALPAHQVFIEMEPRDVPDHLLLAVLIAGSTGRRNPTEVALDLMRRAGGNLANISHLDVVRQTPGMGPSGRARLLSAAEFARRMEYRTEASRRGRVIKGPDDAADILKALVVGPEEHLAAMYLDRRNRVLGTRRLTTGSASYTIVDPRQVMRPAIELGATSIILAHNHPSGDPQSSTQDQEVTQRVTRAGMMLGIPLLDHFIFGRRGNWISMASEGEIPPQGSYSPGLI